VDDVLLAMKTDKSAYIFNYVLFLYIKIINFNFFLLLKFLYLITNIRISKRICQLMNYVFHFISLKLIIVILLYNKN